jgi:hypothetical protein
MIMRPGPDADIYDADYVDEERAAGQHLHDLLSRTPRSQYAAPPPSTVPAKLGQNRNFGRTNASDSDKTEYQNSQPYTGDIPHFVHLEEDMMGQGLKGAFYLSRRMLVLVLMLLLLMLIGMQSVPDFVELIFSFV